MIIIWSPLAKTDYWKNIEYLEENWSENDVITFIEKVDYHINLLKNNKTTFLKVGYKNTYKVVITKQITLFYRVSENSIELLRFWNNYQDLNKLKLK